MKASGRSVGLAALVFIIGSEAACSLIRRTSDLGPPGSVSPSPTSSGSGGGSSGECEGCTVIDEGINDPFVIATSGDFVFYSQSAVEGGSIFRRSKAGGNRTVFANTGALSTVAISPVGNSVAWLGEEGEVGLAARCSEGCQITDTNEGFGTNPPDALLEVDEIDLDSIAADATGTYWTARFEVGATNGTVRFCRATGCNGVATVLADAENKPRGIALDATHVYWVNEGDGRVRRVLRNDVRTPETVITLSLSAPHLIALFDESVYVSDGTSIVSFPKTLSPTSTTPVTLQTSIAAIAVDATGIYWTSFVSSGTIATCPLTGCDEPTVIARVTSPFALALDGDDLWFTTRGGPGIGKVFRVKKTARAP